MQRGSPPTKTSLGSPKVPRATRIVLLCDGTQRKRKSTADSASKTKIPLGTTFMKKFDAGSFEGTVTSFNRQLGCYRIKYEDGNLLLN